MGYLGKVAIGSGIMSDELSSVDVVCPAVSVADESVLLLRTEPDDDVIIIEALFDVAGTFTAAFVQIRGEWAAVLAGVVCISFFQGDSFMSSYNGWLT